MVDYGRISAGLRGLRTGEFINLIYLNQEVMLTTPNRHSNTTELKLMLLSSLNGRVILQGLVWQIAAVGGTQATVVSEEALPVINLAAGQYIISVSYFDKTYDFDAVTLERGTCANIAFLLPELQVMSSEDYFIDYDAAEWFVCRAQERELQSQHGFATLPLRDPKQQMMGEQGIEFKSHPLLKNSTQFDGVPPEIRPDPSENKEALQLTLEQQLKAAPTGVPTLTRTR